MENNQITQYEKARSTFIDSLLIEIIKDTKDLTSFFYNSGFVKVYYQSLFDFLDSDNGSIIKGVNSAYLEVSQYSEINGETLEHLENILQELFLLVNKHFERETDQPVDFYYNLLKSYIARIESEASEARGTTFTTHLVDMIDRSKTNRKLVDSYINPSKNIRRMIGASMFDKNKTDILERIAKEIKEFSGDLDTTLDRIYIELATETQKGE